MLKIKTYKPSLVLAVLAAVFVLSWAVWSFYLVPRSTHPSIPAPMTPPEMTR